MKPYYVLAQFEPDTRTWHPQFGDYLRKIVDAERREYNRTVLGRYLKVVKCDDGQGTTVDAAVRKLNDPIVGDGMVLINRIGGDMVRRGDKMTGRDGTVYTVTDGRPPQHENSSGRIYVELSGSSREFFPHVFDCEWVECEPVEAT
jgi:hypothetical protein